jgi:hypothetical protein
MQSQVFTNLDFTKLPSMNIQDTRRENLRRWINDNGVPAKEKSYFSQLLSGASFGERAARRLESTYSMGNGYLDSQAANVGMALQLVAQPPKALTNDEFSESDEIIELLALFQQSSKKGRQFILKSARIADKRLAARWVKSDDKA